MSESAPSTTAPTVGGRLPGGQQWYAWRATEPVGVVLLVHGAHEHSRRYNHVAERLTAANYAVFALDHLGHGQSPGVRGNIDSMRSAVAGVEALAQVAAAEHAALPTFVYGHSLGGLIALQYLTEPDRAEVRGGIISAPALDTSAGSPLQKALAPVLSRLLPNLGVLPLDSRTISRDPRVVQDYQSDPQVYSGKMRMRTAAEIMASATRMPARLRPLTLPLLLLHGTEDRLMPIAASETVRSQATSAELTVRFYEGLYHEPHNEPEKEQVLGDIVSWLDAHVAAPQS